VADTRDSAHASLLSLSERTMGDAFDTAASIGATTLSLYDVSDFDEQVGGRVSIGGNLYTYDTVDMDADTIHLTTTLTTAAAVDDRVDIWDGDIGVPVTERVALVLLDEQADGDPVNVDVDYALAPLLARSTLSQGQSVSVVRDGDGYRMIAIHGKNNQQITRSDASALQIGREQDDGTIAGISVGPTGGIVRLQASQDARVKTPDQCPSSRSSPLRSPSPRTRRLKTPPRPPPDALAIIAAAPAWRWRYLTDDESVTRIGPMADDLPTWLAQTDPEDGTLNVDLARQTGVLWAALGQQLKINAEMRRRIAALEKGA
jgi:hypothetical protein